MCGRDPGTSADDRVLRIRHLLSPAPDIEAFGNTAIVLVVAVAFSLFLLSCAARVAYMVHSNSKRYRVTSGDREWVASGPVDSDRGMHVFRDDRTGASVSVYGSIVIERIEDAR